MAKRISLILMAGFYFLAGINHFNNPAAYYKIIPAYFTSPHIINFASGALEILLALLILIPKTRRLACYAIICMLIAFIPAHVLMIRTGFCINDFCLPQWALWVRLVVLQPLLILWAWINRK